MLIAIVIMHNTSNSKTDILVTSNTSSIINIHNTHAINARLACMAALPVALCMATNRYNNNDNSINKRMVMLIYTI